MNDYAKSISGITKVTAQAPFLTGKGVLTAVLDSGIDYRNREFIDKNGNTRIVGIWDLAGNSEKTAPPEGYVQGSFYAKEQIQQAIEENSYELVPVIDRSGHGTAVTGVLAGTYGGIATESDILVIKLNSITNELLTTSLMRGVDFAVKYATAQNQPIVLNISIGNNYGDHQGNSLLERFMDNAAEVGRTAIVVGSGNEGAAGGHMAGVLNQETNVMLSVAEYETTLMIQLWKFVKDSFRIKIISPGGETKAVENISITEPKNIELKLGNTTIFCYLGVPLPYQQQQEFLFQFLVQNGGYIESGVWMLVLEPVSIVQGQYRFYLSGSAVRNSRTGFLRPTPDMTLTIPSTAQKVISVGAYDVAYQSYADFSGRGYVYRYEDQSSVGAPDLIAAVKPDLSAPGVHITVPIVNGGYEEVSGTSFAAPFVAGMAALLMEWGIVRKNDPYLYGEKLKAFLTKNARRLSAYTEYPNPQVGWGALDLQTGLD